MNLTEKVSAPLDPVGDIIHLVPLPASRRVSGMLLMLLDSWERDRWFFSMLVEGHDSDSDQEMLSQAARRIGVPVMCPRRPRGELLADWARTLLDEWFFVRSVRPVLLHLHWVSPVPRFAAGNCINYLLPRVPVICSIYCASRSRADSESIVTYRKRFYGAESLLVHSERDIQAVKRIYENVLR